MQEEKLNTLLTELKETKKQSAYCQNHLLDTMIKRVEELINGEFETDTTIGF